MAETGFEARLARGLREMADDGLRPFDPRAIAEAIVAPRRRGLRRVGWLATPETRRWLPLIAAALLLAALLALSLGLVGSHPPRPLEAQRLVFIRNGDIWVANTDGSAARLVVAHQAAAAASSSCLGVLWSPDGSRLATLLEADLQESRGSRTIAILTDVGAAVGTIDVELGPMAMAWSPDGDHLAVFAPSAGGASLQIFGRDGGLERALALPSQARPSNGETPTPSVKWSPDGQTLAISVSCPCGSDSQHTWTVAVDGSSTAEIHDPGGRNVSSVAWSPNGNKLTMASGDQDSGELWVAGTDGSSVQRIATTFGQIVEVSGWSPDGTWIAFFDSAIDVVRADGSGDTFRFGASSLGARWSERQRLFYLAAPVPPSEDTPAAWQGIGSIMVLDPAGGRDPAVAIGDVDARSPFDIH
jgi:dipeptidyl aminopeptidase/acylaminoacyl peptidase